MNVRVKQISDDVRGATNGYVVYNDSVTTLVHFDSMIVQIDTSDYNNKKIYVYRDYSYSKSTVMLRNYFMRYMGFSDMDNTKGFEYYMNLGAIGNYEIIKKF